MATPIQQVILRIDNKDYIFGLQRAEAETQSFANQATRSFNQADAASNKLNLSASNLTGGLVKLKSTLGTIAFGAFAANALASVDAIADLSSSTDISISKLLEFQKALQLSGGNANDLTKVISEFYQSIDQANQGSDQAINNFAKLGVSLKDLKTLSEADLLDKTIKGFERIKDPIERAALAREKFGKSMNTVELARLSQEIDNQRGKFENQQRSIETAAESIERFENVLVALRLGFVQAVEPILKFTGAMDEGGINADVISQRIRQLGVVLGAYFVGSGLIAIVRGIMAIAAAFRAVGVASAFASAGITAVTGIAAALAAGVALDKMMGNPIGQDLGIVTPPEANISTAEADRRLEEQRRIRDNQNKARDRERRNREQQIGKELQSQLNTINQLMDGYRRAAQANMDRNSLETEILGKSQEEVETMRGRAEIEKRYSDQIAALEEKKKGAKGQTLALITQSIKELENLKSSELDIFDITRGQIQNYKIQQDEIKRITDQIEKRIATEQQLGEVLKRINDQRVDINFEKSLKGLTPLQKEIARINENARKAALEAGRAFAAAFDTEDGLTPERAEELAKGLNAIAQGYKNIAAAQIEGLGPLDEFTNGLINAWETYKETANDISSQVKRSFENFTSGMEDAFVRFVQTGKLSFKDLANSILADLARIAVKRAIVFFGSSLFPGLFKAQGGPVDSRTPYVVGEKGPELFIPNTAGKIIPNHALSSGGGAAVGGQTMVTYNINAVDASSFRALVARDPSFIYAVTEQGRRSQPSRRIM